MSEKWKLTEEQNTGPIYRVSKFFIDELNELESELDFPDEFIYDLMEARRNLWSLDSRHAQASSKERTLISDHALDRVGQEQSCPGNT